MRGNLANIGVVIPAYNAEKTIPKVIEGLINFGFERENIILIDDGSVDGTYRVSKGYGIEVGRHLENRGKGAAQRTGFSLAIKKGFPYVLTLDADGQHRIEELAHLLNRIEESDIIIGNRMSNIRSMPLLNRISNLLTSLIVSLFINRRIRDSQCGFRLIRTGVLKNIPLKTSHYQTESEFLIKAGQMGYKITEVPITTLYQNNRSFIHPLLDTLRFIILIIKSFRR